MWSKFQSLFTQTQLIATSIEKQKQNNLRRMSKMQETQKFFRSITKKKSPFKNRKEKNKTHFDTYMTCLSFLSPSHTQTHTQTPRLLFFLQFHLSSNILCQVASRLCWKLTCHVVKVSEGAILLTFCI